MGTLTKFILKVDLLVRNFLSKDCFGLLDILWILGGSLNLPRPGWKRRLYFLWHGLTVFHFVITLRNVGEKISGGNDFSMTMWYLSFTAATSVCLIKMVFMWYHDKSIRQVVGFINSKHSISGDVRYDQSVRDKYSRKAQITLRIIFGLMILYQVLFSIPHPQQDKLYHFPLLAYIEPAWVCRLVQFMYISTIPVIWFSKYFWCTGMIVAILINLQGELKILIHKFQAVLERTENTLDEELFQSNEGKEKFWNQLNNDLRLTLEQHIAFITHFQLAQPILGVSFLLYYYFALATYASVLLLIMSEPISFVTFFQAISVLGSVLECYLICLLVDTFQDMNEEFQSIARDICIRLPRNEGDQHHSDYVQARTALMIVILSNNSPISCAGVFDISVATFAGLIDTSYSYLKFLLSFR